LSLAALTNVSGGALINGDFDEYVFPPYGSLKRVISTQNTQILTIIIRIHLPNLKTVGYLNIESTGSLDCVALGKNLSSLAFTPPKFYFGSNPGFTCWSQLGKSTYNSSDHDGSTSSSGSASSVASTSTSISTSTSTRGGAVASSTSGGAANPTSTR
jgi:hypothetical protein